MYTHTTHSLSYCCHKYYIYLKPVQGHFLLIRSTRVPELSSEGKKKLQTSRYHQVVSLFQGKFHSSFYLLFVTLHCFQILKEFSLVISVVWSHQATLSLQKPNLHSQPFSENFVTLKASLEINKWIHLVWRGRTRLGTSFIYLNATSRYTNKDGNL